MGKMFSSISKSHQDFIKKQKVFFVGTAAESGTVNISPKGLEGLRILNQNKVIWLNLTGSGNETGAHLLKNNRMTIMFCAFEGNPLILRLYGTAKIFHTTEDSFKKYQDLFEENIGARQIIELEIERVQTSCGFGVPLMDFIEDRDDLLRWSEKKGVEGIQTYWKDRNQKSIDGFDSKILNKKSESSI